MENLPFSLLQAICEQVAILEPNRSSLWAFARTSKACYAGTGRERFSRILFKVNDEERFRQSLLHLDGLLETTGCRRHVRVVKICQTENLPTQIMRNGFDEIEDPFSIPPISRIDFYAGAPAPQRDFWGILARFLSKLALRDLIWAVPEQVPSCILSMLHEHLPTSRLHVQTFSLRSLIQGNNPQSISDTDYLLATSPCLYSILGPYSPFDPAGRADYNEEAIQEMAAGSTPSLKHVHVWSNYRASPSGELNRRPRRERLPWLGFHPQSVDEPPERLRTKGKVESLKINAAAQVDQAQFARWEAHVNVSHLRSLQFTRYVALEVLDRLSELAESGLLDHLRNLSLPPGLSRAGGVVKDYPAMQRLLLSLQPLDSLSLESIGNSTFDAAMEQHGASLQSFRGKDTILSCEQIKRLGSCTRMRKLTVEALRIGGNEEEVTIYRTLRAVPNLEKLSLKLHCVLNRVRPDGEDEPAMGFGIFEVAEEEAQEMKDAFRQTFINAAMDEHLAQSIFEELMGVANSACDAMTSKLACIQL
ncbi:hypothetical protein P154DRAFT_106168 [Amniculicola lignicola CBS 123094]|uniref:Uncharacterized protein n=1 Tax=Amniculicola lignicola CBS 123094 TaxID=1392246 RepID=A0A6A5VUH4_9PLEO|nr:hypothetical protein P154DRAFT_106168 [Amniculicola lignicola CBS 123094]